MHQLAVGEASAKKAPIKSIFEQFTLLTQSLFTVYSIEISLLLSNRFVLISAVFKGASVPVEFEYTWSAPSSATVTTAVHNLLWREHQTGSSRR